ncbi:ATP-binding protein [Streptacidiphilus jiangxiensis]|uniref:ATP-binding protein n=1 Tax=Streptacidiphilus jiangxiensis TaxID=235985 RepID=UPI000694A528|nr:ATP-binding protein [Streptacidiphilus jiangxiensis]
MTAFPSGPWHLELSGEAGVDRVATGIAFVRRALAEGRADAEPREADGERALDVVLVDVVLVAAELLGNAERHGGGTRSVDLEHRPGLLRIIVCDTSPLPPRPVLPHRAERAGGHGLHIVAVLSADWGWSQDGPGKAVWADLPLPPVA